MINVGIVGGTGYTGVELLRLLAQHPAVNVKVITSRAEAGQKVSDLFPNLRGHLDLAFSEPQLIDLQACDVVFFATPNGTAMQMAPALLAANVKVIDLSADFRIKNIAIWENWYGMTHHCPQWVEKAVYGLPEFNRTAIANAQLIACPGCYPTSVLLGFWPLLTAQAVDIEHLIADVKSGVSGAGRKAAVSTLMGEMGESFKAYSVNGHRHLPEIVQQLELFVGTKIHLTFVPHLLPMVRGIHATLYAQLQPQARELDIQTLFEQHYQKTTFVDVLPAGHHPETRHVRGVNRCQLAVHRPQGEKTVVVLSVIDNLVKGAAGQAIQNMNIMYDLAETQGLEGIGLLP